MSSTAGSKTVAARGVKCAQCGAPFTLRGFARTRSVACEYCGALFDTSTQEWQLLERVEHKRQVAPIWPLGTRARFEGRRFDLVGWVKRYVVSGGDRYYWEEHLFFSPFHGFRYLVHQDGHFTLVTPLPGVPETSAFGGPTATYEHAAYRHFSQGHAIVDDVVGEFPWIVKRGERVLAVDYVAPPLLLSKEQSDDETVWSRGVYMEQSEVFAAVGPPRRHVFAPRGVAPCQPNPVASLAWLGAATAAALLAWCLLTVLYVFRCSNETILDATVPPKPVAVVARGAVAPVTTDAPPLVFPLKVASSRDPANLEVTGTAAVDNGWAFCGCSLVDTKTEQGSQFGLEVSYYHGYEDGESWSEGSTATEVLLGPVPNGDYVLQVERDDKFPGPVRIIVRRDVALARYPLVALFLIVFFPAILLLRSRSFEAKRWAESDHAG